MAYEEIADPMVRVNVQLTYDDYQAYCRQFANKTSRFQRFYFYGFVILMMIAYVYCEIFLNRPWIKWSFLGICGLWWLGSWLKNVRLRKTQWETQNYLREPVTYVFSPSGLQIAAIESETKATWKSILSAERAGSLFLLEYFNGCYFIIPERAFVDGGDCGVFQQLVEAKVAKVKF
jgi:hypothetical protein